MPKISVLIPVFNSEKYLKNCLKSVVNQTFDDIEIIVINDGSYDNSEKIINSFKKNDNRIRIINKENTGYANSLNVAIKEAKGEYISIIESDDIANPKLLEVLFNEAEKNNTDITKASFYLLKKEKYAKYPAFKGIDTSIIHNVSQTPEILTIKPSVWSAIYKKDFILRNKLFFNETSGASYQDTSFQFKAMYLAKKIKLINTPLYLYRIDNANSSINSSDKVFDICNEFSVINSFLENEELKNEIINQKILFELRAYIWNIKRIKEKYLAGFVEKIFDVMKEYNYEAFLADKKIPFEDKAKFWLLLNHKKIFISIFWHLKNYANRKVCNKIKFERFE